MTNELSTEQRALIRSPLARKHFLEGPAGAGKTTVGVRRLLRLLDEGVPAEQVLVLAPQRTLAAPYTEALQTSEVPAGGSADVLTVGGLARRSVALFWPLVAEAAGFQHPDAPPTFLTLETAQYHMARVARPLLEEGYFESVTLERNRLYSQLLDNLNKAAIVGFPLDELGPRLEAAWVGDEAQHNVYRDMQGCVKQFRAYCLEHNLLDFSLQVETFVRHVWTTPAARKHLLERYTHLIAENIEEDAPVSHDLLREWLPVAASALLIYDTGAGYRSFLGADPAGARELAALCDERVSFETTFINEPPVAALRAGLSAALRSKPVELDGDPRPALHYASQRFHPQMIDWTCEQIAELVHREDVPPGEVAVLAPFMSDALRFALVTRLEALGVSARSHRPSRALSEEPGAGCLLTLAALAHPRWALAPRSEDIVTALMQAIEGLDPVRADLLVETLYQVREGIPTLLPFEQLKSGMAERVTYARGERYESLRTWLETYIAGEPEPLDHWLGRLFGELLGQPGFGFHRDLDAARTAANLIESIKKFRWAAGAGSAEGDPEVGREYLQLVREGVVAAQYLRGWAGQGEEAVLLAPAYTFLLSNRPADVQVWLNVSSPGWWERVDQPLTHPYVLSRHWPQEQVWTDEHEVEANGEALHRLATGLLRRCRKRVYLGLSELDEGGMEQQGPLLRALQRLLRALPNEPEVERV